MVNPEADDLEWQRRSGKKTVVIGHSKGGLDTLQALAKHTELSRMVSLPDKLRINSWLHYICVLMLHSWLHYICVPMLHSWLHYICVPMLHSWLHYMCTDAPFMVALYMCTDAPFMVALYMCTDAPFMVVILKPCLFWWPSVISEPLLHWCLQVSYHNIIKCQCAFWWPTVCSEPLLFVCANIPLTAIVQVRGLVCVQSPFGGSPIATDIVYGPGLVRDAVHTGLTGLLRGSFSCINDLTHRSRRDWFLKNKNQVNKVTKIDQFPHNPNSERCPRGILTACATRDHSFSLCISMSMMTTG
jgi:hypothetical protein